MEREIRISNARPGIPVEKPVRRVTREVPSPVPVIKPAQPEWTSVPPKPVVTPEREPVPA